MLYRYKLIRAWKSNVSYFVSHMGIQLFEVAREYGVKRVATILSDFSFFFLPFVFWADIYLVLGKSFFVPFWLPPAIIIAIGLSVLIYITIIVIMSSVLLNSPYSFEKKFMRKVEENSINEKERASIAMSYLHFRTLSTLGVFDAPSVQSLIGYLLVSGAQIFVSYSLVSLFVTNRDSIVQMLIPIYEPISQTLHLPQPSIFTLSFLLFCLFLLSLYVWGRRFFMLVRFYKGNQIQIPREFAIFLPVSFVSIPSRIGLLSGCLLVAADSLTGSRLYSLGYRPFVISSNISKIIQKAFENAQGEECIVTEHKYEMTTEKEVETLKSEINRHFKTLASAFHIMNVNSAKALDIITKQRLILYLGFVEKQCVFVGMIGYNIVRRVRVAFFHFDNPYTRREFQAIVEKEINKAREI